MSVKRRDIIRHLEKNGFFLKRQGGNHSVYTNKDGINVPVGRHSTFTRYEANDMCKQANIQQIF